MRASLQLLLLLGLLGPAQGQLCTPTSAEEAIISFTGATTKHDNLGGYGCGWGYNPGCIESGTSGVCPTSTTQLADFTSGDLTPASGWPSTGSTADPCDFTIRLGGVLDAATEARVGHQVDMVVSAVNTYTAKFSKVPLVATLTPSLALALALITL